jgi:hypothetical protein
METTPKASDKPWRPGDHPRPGPSWDEVKAPSRPDDQGGSNAED